MPMKFVNGMSVESVAPFFKNFLEKSPGAAAPVSPFVEANVAGVGSCDWKG